MPFIVSAQQACVDAVRHHATNHEPGRAVGQRTSLDGCAVPRCMRRPASLPLARFTDGQGVGPIGKASFAKSVGQARGASSPQGLATAPASAGDVNARTGLASKNEIGATAV